MFSHSHPEPRQQAYTPGSQAAAPRHIKLGREEQDQDVHASPFSRWPIRHGL